MYYAIDAVRWNDHGHIDAVPGDSGRFFKMKACPQGIDAELDESGTPLRERMAHPPRF